MKHRKSFTFLVFSQVIMAAGFSLSFPFLAVYLNTQRDIAMSFIGIFLALSVFFTSFAQILGGEISDKIGRKLVMQIALFLRGISILFIAYLIKEKGSVALIMAAHMIGVFFGSFFRPAANSWVADSTTPGQRVRAYGLLRIGVNLGWALGPALGGFMAQSSYAMMFFYTFISNIICVFIIGIFVDNTIVISSVNIEKLSFKTIRQVLAHEKFMRFCVAIFTMAIVMSQLIVSSSLYCLKYLNFTEVDVGILFSLNGMIVVGLQYFVSKYLEKIKITSGLAIGAFLSAVGYFIFGFSFTFSIAIIAVIIFTFGELAVSPGIHAMTANLADEKHKGRFMGVEGLFYQLGYSFGIFIGTNSLQFLSPHFQAAPWVITAIISLVAAYLFYRLGFRLTRTENGLKEDELNYETEEPGVISS